MSSSMYEQIYEKLREEIRSGLYQVGDRVPSEKELADAYNVSRITSKKALEMLADGGLIVRRPGRGSFVADPASKAEAAAASPGKGGSRGGLPGARPMIGLVMTDFSDSYGTGLVYGMEEASRKHDAFLVLRRSFGIPSLEEKAIQSMLELGVDGLIIFPAQGEYFNAEILKLVIDKFPFVLVDRHLKGISAGSISTDNAAGAKRGVDYLFELGHKRVAIITPPPADTTAVEDRIEGYVQAHAEKGIVVDRELWLSVTSTLPSAYTDENKARDIEKIKRHLLDHPEISAFFAMEYNIALLVREAARQLGLDVPQDLSIICFDCPDNGSGFSFTHLRQNQEEMGRAAFENVLQLRDGKTVPPKITLEAELIVGKSTAVPSPSRIGQL